MADRVPEEKKLKYLMQVYFSLASTTLSCASGALVQLLFDFSLVTAVVLSFTLGVIGTMLYLIQIEEKKKKSSVVDDVLHIQLLLFICFLHGLILSPLLRVLLDIDRSSVTSILFTTSLVCLSFSISADQAGSRMSMELAGLTLSSASLLAFFSLVAIFSGTELDFEMDSVSVPIFVIIFLTCNASRLMDGYNGAETELISWDHYLTLLHMIEFILLIFVCGRKFFRGGRT